MSIQKRSGLLVLLCVLSVALASIVVGRHRNSTPSRKTVPPAAIASTPVPPTGPEETHIYMRHVIFRVLPNVALDIDTLDGLMAQVHAGQVISLDDPNSFTLEMQSARTSISSRDLSALVNSYILPRSGAPIRDLDMKLNPDQTVSVSGKFHKVIDLDFESTATLQATPQGNMRMHLFDMRVGHILHQSILDFLGVKVAKFAQPKNAQVFRMEGNDMIFPISEMFPPPRVEGKLQSLSIVNGRLHFIFGGTPAASFAPPEPAPNYIFFHGGPMRFGRLTMTPVDMELVNLKPADAFEFSLAQYFQQIVAGYSKSLPNGGLLVHMANYSENSSDSGANKSWLGSKALASGKARYLREELHRLAAKKR